MPEVTYDASFGGISPAGLELLQDLLGPYAEALGKDIEVDCPHGEDNGPHTPKTGDKLYLRLFAIPDTVSDAEVVVTDYPKHWGVAPGEGQTDRIEGAASGAGTPIETSEGIPYGEEYGGNIYIYYDVIHRATRLAVNRRYTQAALNGVMLNYIRTRAPEKELGLAEAAAAAAEKREQEEFVNVFLANARSMRETVQRELDESGSQVGSAEAELVRVLREREEKRQRLLSMNVETNEARVRKERVMLGKMSGIQSVAVDDGNVMVLTDPMNVEWKDHTYALGRFYINISGDGTLRVEAHPDNVRPSSYHHPHVSGGVCWGNAYPGISKLLADFEVAAAVQLTLAFLETVNESGWYYPIFKWPLVGGGYLGDSE